MQFSHEQQLAFDLYLSGKNVFLTGPGGTGKSKWIQSVYADACKKKINVQVCAMTGCAALLLECNAKTIHSWAGIGLGTSSDKAISNKFSREKWKAAKILILDEVSMLSLRLFELLNKIGQTIRRSTLPFGGIQLLFCGDFFQLPPIEPGFCFESPLWATFTTVQLITIFRQKDEDYQTILSEIRHGKLSKKSYQALLERIQPCENTTHLVPTRSQADTINTRNYSLLSGIENTYDLQTHTDLEMTEREAHKQKQFNKQQIEYELTQLKKNVRCEHTYALKVGSLVMCIVNLSETICNGSQGIVTGFTNHIPIVKFKHGEIPMPPHVWTSETIPGIGVSQIPLIYAWAITIHKSQGCTLDSAKVNAGDAVFECGQIYVALSRVKSLGGLYLEQFNSNRIFINKKVFDFYTTL